MTVLHFIFSELYLEVDGIFLKVRKHGTLASVGSLKAHAWPTAHRFL